MEKMASKWLEMHSQRQRHTKLRTQARSFIYSTPGGALTAAREETVRRTRVNVIER